MDFDVLSVSVRLFPAGAVHTWCALMYKLSGVLGKAANHNYRVFSSLASKALHCFSTDSGPQLPGLPPFV